MLRIHKVFLWVDIAGSPAAFIVTTHEKILSSTQKRARDKTL